MTRSWKKACILDEVIDETVKWFKDKKTLFICDNVWPRALKGAVLMKG